MNEPAHLGDSLKSVMDAAHRLAPMDQEDETAEAT